jgi:hypothetical protein
MSKNEILIVNKKMSEIKTKKTMINTNVEVKSRMISHNDKFIWYNFVEHLNKKTFDSYEKMKKYLTENIGRVLIYIREGEGFYLKKDGVDSSLLLNPIKNLGDKTKCVVKFKQQKINKEMEVEVFLTKIKLSKILDILITDGKIKTYSSSNFYPKMKIPNHIYNSWTGFEVDRGDKISYDYNKVKDFLDFILKQICDNNVENYNYLLSWIKSIYLTPNKKTMSTIILYSTTHGTGKGTFMNFLIDCVFGSHISTMGYGLDKILGKFNSLLENKIFIGVDEMRSRGRGEYSIDNEKLKNIIVEDKIQIERKNFPVYDSNNHLNFMINSNNLGIVRVESSDRRFVPIQVCESTKSEKYWDNIRDKYINKETGKQFIHYLTKDFNDDVSLRNIPNSHLKKRMKISSGHQGERLILDIKEDEYDIEPFTLYNSNKYILEEERLKLKGLISAKLFYKMYKDWCEETGERAIKKRNILEYLLTKSFIEKGIIKFPNSEGKTIKKIYYKLL